MSLQIVVPRPLAHAHVEYEAGRYVGFLVDGAKVRRIAETRDRRQAKADAEVAAHRINVRRKAPRGGCAR